MFSPTVASGPAAGTRSRRRQRPKSTDSLAQPPKAKRQRVPLTEQTFVNPDVRAEAVDAKPERPAAVVDLRHEGIENMPVPRRELGIRAKKPKASERVSKGDGSAVLVGIPIVFHSWPRPLLFRAADVCFGCRSRCAGMGLGVSNDC